MEPWIYFAVRLAAAVYILYKVWDVLFNKRLYGLWERIPVRRPTPKKEKKPSVATVKKTSRLVGEAHGGYLAGPAPALDPVPVIPVAPEDGTVDEDPEAEFEIGPDVERPSDEELYGAGYEYPPVTDISTGRTYEQLTEAVEFIAAPVEDDEKMMRTAATLSLIRGSELFEFIEREVSSTDAIGRIMAECLDENGEILPRRRSKLAEEQLASFDIEQYL